MALTQNIIKYAESLGAKGRVDMARIALKLGKKIEQASNGDEPKIRQLAKEIWGKDFP